jgi:hypothetical protein
MVLFFVAHSGLLPPEVPDDEASNPRGLALPGIFSPTTKVSR